MSQYRKTMADQWPDKHLILGPTLTEEAASACWGEATTLRFDGLDSWMPAIGAAWRSGSLPFAAPPWRTTSVEFMNAAVLLMATEGPGHESVVASAFWRTKDNGMVGPVGSTAYMLTSDASTTTDEITANLQMNIAPEDLGALAGVEKKTGMTTDSAVAKVLFSAIFAVSLTHCRNVTSVEQCPPPALSKRHAERHGRPLCRYYVLDIEPMRKALHTEGRMGEVGIARALHLCRGHFADYREGNGLFGKHKGLFWWDAHVRGSVASGVVAKDYAVSGPGDAG